jgi:hypothetical protein
VKAIITVGISASGKTTWALQQTGYRVVCRDDVRRQILESKLDRKLVPGELWKMWKWKDEDQVTALVAIEIADAVKNNQDIIIADTNLVEKYRKLTIKRLEELGYEVELKLFPIDFAEAVKRDAGRPDGVGAGVLWKQMKQYHETIGTQKYVRDTTLDKAVIFDIDGTTAKMSNRGPFEWDKVDQDTVIEDVAAMFHVYKAAGYKMIVMSGRDGICRDRTWQWLVDHDLKPCVLLMRAAGDSRKDSVIKRELFFKHVASYYNVCMVVDDRPQMTREWELIGLTVARMANQYEEF